jgi:hypothetical protein
MRWVGHVARVGEMRGANMVLVENPEGKKRLGRQGIDVRIMLKCI